MGFKKIDPKLTFAEIALASSMEKNRSLDTLMNMNAVIDWAKIEKLLLKQYIIGKSSEGADAYRKRKEPMIFVDTLQPY